MPVNGMKFEWVKHGHDSNLKKSCNYLNLELTEAIEDKETVRDLGVLV